VRNVIRDLAIYLATVDQKISILHLQQLAIYPKRLLAIQIAAG